MSWEVLLRLAVLWTRARANVQTNVLDWFDAQPADVVLALARALPDLGAAVCVDTGDLVPKVEQWSSAVVVVMVLRERWRMLPRECVAAFCERVAALGKHADIVRGCAEVQAQLGVLEQEPASKRQRMDETSVAAAPPEPLDGSESDMELSLSLGDDEPSHAPDGEDPRPASAPEPEPAQPLPSQPSQQSAAWDAEGAVAALREYLERRAAAGSRAGGPSQGAGLPADVLALLNDAGALDRVKDAVASASDEVVRDLFAALGTGLDLRVSGRAHAALVSVTLLPRVAALRKPVPRVLAALVLDCVKQSPRAAVDGLLRPLLADEADALLGAPQAELVNRCLQDGALDVDTKLSLVRVLWSGSGAAWSAHAVSVLQKALALEGLEGALGAADLASFVARVNEQCAQCAGDVKFGKLLQTFVNRFGALMAPATVDAALRAAESLTSMVRKPIVAKLKTLLK